MEMSEAQTVLSMINVCRRQNSFRQSFARASLIWDGADPFDWLADGLFAPASRDLLELERATLMNCRPRMARRRPLETPTVSGAPLGGGIEVAVTGGRNPRPIMSQKMLIAGRLAHY